MMKTDRRIDLYGARSTYGAVRRLAFGCISLAAIVSAGCGGGASGPQGKVSGKVTYKGNPVATGATVSFLGSAGGGSAAGTVGSDGSYQLRSMNGDQIPAGKYKVLITPPVQAAMSPEEAMKASMPSGKSKPGIPEKPPADATIPSQYHAINTTPAEFEVKQGDNVINIELEDKK